MPYHNLPGVIACSEFVDTRVLIRLVSKARRIPFSVKAERDRTRDLFNNVHRVEVSVDTRFPVIGRFANITTDLWLTSSTNLSLDLARMNVVLIGSRQWALLKNLIRLMMQNYLI